MTEREYLISMGLAKPGRGRYSREAKAALESARKAGKTFDGPPVKVAAERPVSKPTEPARPRPASDQYDPKAVREWARAQGKIVGMKGRLETELLHAYLDSDPDRPVEARNITASSVIELRPRTLAQGSRFVQATARGNANSISDANICGNCGVSLGWHTCHNPTALVRGTMDYVPVRMVG